MFKDIVKNWVLILISIVFLAIGCGVAIWGNNMNAQQIMPGYIPETVNWVVTIPLIAVQFSFIIVGFVAGKLYEDKNNAV